MDAIFRLPSAMARDPAIERWMQEQPGGLRPLAARWFACLKACGDDVREVFHDGRPTACIGDAAFAYVGAYKEHVIVGFFYGALLKDPAGLLQGTGKRMRHVKMKPGEPLNQQALAGLIASAYADLKVTL